MEKIRTKTEKKPWELEPNTKHFNHAGLPCLVARHNEMKHLCGYVGLSRGHPFYGFGSGSCLLGCRGKRRRLFGMRKRFKSYDCTIEQNHPTLDELLHVHGGITFASKGDQYRGRWKKYWWIGFDCAHAFDYLPGMEKLLKDISEYRPTTLGLPGGYKDFAYVTDECKKLAEQLRRYGRFRWFWQHIYFPVLPYLKRFSWWKFRQLRRIKKYYQLIEVNFFIGMAIFGIKIPAFKWKEVDEIDQRLHKVLSQLRAKRDRIRKLG